ncbi:hypothetical protein WKK05_41550 (plasmid) [Nostoc sp. UHCC 0302]|uniref:hypothetical protein n=1 Tax=Nostoc sp. UHCC 0302 TaxID=3134896 RepID=UPI00311CC3F3
MTEILVIKNKNTLEVVFPARKSLSIIYICFFICFSVLFLLICFSSLFLLGFYFISLISTPFIYLFIITFHFRDSLDLFKTRHLIIDDKSITFTDKLLDIKFLNSRLPSVILRENICMLVSTATSYKLIDLGNQEKTLKSSPSLIIWEGIKEYDLREYLKKNLTLIERDRIAQEISNFLGIAIVSENLSGTMIPFKNLPFIGIEFPRIQKPVGSNISFTISNDNLEVIIPYISNYFKLEINQYSFSFSCNASSCYCANGFQDNRYNISNLLCTQKSYKEVIYKYRGRKNRKITSISPSKLCPELFLSTQNGRYRLGCKLTFPEIDWLAQELSEFLNIPVIWE